MSIETILKIEETNFDHSIDGYNQNYEGYVITTTEQEIKVGISSGQSCCENYGYLSTNDELSEFVGAELISIEQVDKALNATKLKDTSVEESEAMFINFSTSHGFMQLVAYNSHNGYYGHDAVLISKQITQSVSL